MSVNKFGGYCDVENWLSGIETWGEALDKAMTENHDLDEPVEDTLRGGRDLGIRTSVAFAVWTERFVYFPATYDGLYWVESVPRNPGKQHVSPVGC